MWMYQRKSQMMLNKSDSFEAGIPRYSLQPVGGRARILHAPSNVPAPPDPSVVTW